MRGDFLFSLLFHAVFFIIISFVKLNAPMRFVEVSLSADVSTVPQNQKKTVHSAEKKSLRKARLWTPGDGVPLPDVKISPEKKFDFSPPVAANEPQPDISGFEEKPEEAAPDRRIFTPDFGATGQGMQISGPVSTRSVMRRVYPEYPEGAQSAGISGQVLIKFWVAPSGIIEKTLVDETSGSDALDRSAENAVKKWLFAPLSANEEQLEQWGRITVKFELR